MKRGYALISIKGKHQGDVMKRFKVPCLLGLVINHTGVNFIKDIGPCKYWQYLNLRKASRLRKVSELRKIFELRKISGLRNISKLIKLFGLRNISKL